MNIDRSWLKYQHGPEFMRGIKEFISLAKNNLDKKNRAKCPCKKCRNTEFRGIDEVYDHLINFGMEKDYTNWVFHGEPEFLSSGGENGDNDGLGSRSEGLGDMFEDFEQARVNLDSHMQDDESDDEEVDFPDLNEGRDDSFYKLWNDARLPLYPGCKSFSKLGLLLKLLHEKIINRMSNKAFNTNLELLKASLPEGVTLPKSYYETKVLLRSLGLGYIPIHACIYDCALYWKENENLQCCPVCQEPRYKNPEAKGKKIPQKVLRYFPLKTRLQRLYMSRMTAKDMRWHKEKRVYEKDVYRHPADSQAWEDFDKEYEWFASDPRNVRLGIATDGFNPYGDMSSSYSMWPVMVVPYNMPPWKCMKEPFIFMSLLIPGPKAPGNDIDVYLRPLVDELKELWEPGVKTFDAVTKKSFQLHAGVIWSINDYPAYGNLSGWSTKGKLACPTCNNETTSMYLKIGRKLCYMNHVRFLQPRHSLRKRAHKLFGHLKWSSSRPKHLSGDEVLEQLAKCVGQIKFGKNPKHPKRKRSESELNWSKKSIFFELPYWPKLKIRHNLDVMHIEKNICESVLGTLLKLDGKTKDTVKARMDLQLMGIRPELHLVEKPNNKYLVPQASYTLSPAEKKIFCEWLKAVKFPDGFASNISRCVNVKDCKISGMKSHDCHVLLQRLLPVALRGFLADDIALALIELGFFFKELCCKTLKLEVLEKMERDIAVIICKLEQIFPPAFFDVMVHLAVHLPREAIYGGPVQYRWMYPIERFLHTLKQYVRNKTHPEGSIAEGYIDSECVAFCSMYLEGIETRFNRRDRNFDGDVGKKLTGLEVFSHNVRPLGASKNYEMSLDDYIKAEFFVLNNSEEISSFLQQHKDELKKQNPRASNKAVDKLHERSFASWFLGCIQRLKAEKNPIATDELFDLACRPDRRVRRYSGCIVNGIRFHTSDRETNLRTQNSGVAVKGEYNGQDIDFFGVLKDIIRLEYVGNQHVYLFRCDWWDVGNKNTGINVDQHFISVNVSKTWYEDDQFVLANQVSQVFYMSDTKKKGTWQVVQRIEPRNIYNVLEKEEDEEEETQVVHDIGVYQEEMLVVNEIQDKEVAVDMLNRVDVIPDEVDASTISKNLETLHEEEYIAAMENIEVEDDTMINYYSGEEEGRESVTRGLESVVLIDEESDLEE